MRRCVADRGMALLAGCADINASCRKAANIMAIPPIPPTT
jgi:hypothetical protein